MSEIQPHVRRFAFPRAERLQKKREFERIYAAGVRLRTREFVFLAMPNGLAVSRAGIVASRKVGDAPRRNRAKRILRAAYRLNKSRIGVPCDVVLIATPSWERLRLEVVEPELQRTIEKLNAILRR